MKREALSQLGQNGGGVVYVSFDPEWPNERSGNYFFQRREETNIFFRQYCDHESPMLALEAFSCPTELLAFEPQIGISVMGARTRGPQVLDGSQETASQLAEILKRNDMWIGEAA